ncbi:unnamed protein product [Paramecium primaurelia]|uniref:VWFA domain-containing protein n=1 Tax=Paramecium primaurelia TaxID=5886 RepID=A0A8S1Q815_PARPR|nr:unnamed protein product [Paramecium primaurelia]
MDQEVHVKYFKLPQKDSNEKGMLISILDCSGSMSSYWQYVAKYYNELKEKSSLSIAITFDTQVKVLQPNEIINPNINQYGGGGTNITCAFVALNQEIQKRSITSDLTVVFVSDGQGSYDEKAIKQTMPNVQNLNFICVGVGNGFPTHISMSLRSLYHTGNLSIPPVFIVSVQDQSNGKQRDQFLDSIFQEEFQSVGVILKPRIQCETTPCLCFPWSQETTTKVWSGSWVGSYDNEITFDGIQVQSSNPSEGMILELASFWLQNIQLLSLKQNVKQEAQMALAELERLSNLIPKLQGQKKQKTFAQRVQESQQKETELSDFVAELKLFTQDFTLSKLSDKDAADRLKIGTKIGKFHNKALKFAGLSLEDFTKAKQQFIQLLKEYKFDGNDGDRSIMTLQSQKEILQEEDLIFGLENCTSQYQLVTAFPIIGYGLQVKRSNASMIDPYKIEIVSLVRIHKFIDSVSLIENAQHELKFQVGNGEEEIVNCILPLYTSKNEDLKPFFRSLLFHTIMTFVVCENADVCFDYSYAALLANTLYYLIRQPKTEWTKEMISLINESYTLAYGMKYKNFTEKLINNPIQTLVDVNKDFDTQCQDTIKALLILSAEKNNYQLEQIRNVVNRFLIETIGRLMKDMALKDHINYFFNQENEGKIITELSQRIINGFDNEKLKEYKTMSAITSQIFKEVEEIKIEDWQLQVTFKKDQVIKFLSHTKYKYEDLQLIYEYFLIEEIPQNLFIASVFHARHQRSIERANKEFIADFDLLNKEILQVKHTFLKSELLEKCKVEIRTHVQKMGINNLFVQRMPGFGISRRRRRRPNVNKLAQKNP